MANNLDTQILQTLKELNNRLTAMECRINSFSSVDHYGWPALPSPAHPSVLSSWSAPKLNHPYQQRRTTPPPSTRYTTTSAPRLPRPPPTVNHQPGREPILMHPNNGLLLNPKFNTHGQHKHRQAKPTPRPMTVTNNPDFTSNIKNIYRFVQIEHHKQVWKELPQKIDTHINELIDFIKPPMPNDTLRHSLAEIGNLLKSQILIAVQEHLARTSDEVINTLERNCPVDINDASKIATEQLQKRLGKKISATHRTEMLTKAVQYVGRQVAPVLFSTATPSAPSTSIPSAPTTNTPSTESENQSLPWQHISTLRHDQPDRRKRTRSMTDLNPYSTTIPTANFFEPLVTHLDSSPTQASTPKRSNLSKADTSVQNESTDDKDSEGASLSLSFAESIQTQEDDNEMETAHDSTTPEDMPPPTTSIYACHRNMKKSLWRIKLDPKTHTLVIGDSNAIHMRNLPSGWQVDVFPGANHIHATSIVKNIEKTEQLKNIVIAVGINHRTWNFQTSSRSKLSGLNAALNKTKCCKHFLGIAIPPNLPPIEKTNLNDLNKNAQLLFKYGFIDPLPSELVQIEKNDKYKVHYNQDTAKLIVDRLVSKVDHLN